MFVTQYRREVFTQAILDDLRSILIRVSTDFEAERVELDEEGNHIRVQANHPPKVTVSPLVGRLNNVSNSKIREKIYRGIRKSVVVVLLRWKPLRCAPGDHSPAHRTAADTAMTTERTPTVSTLSFPGLMAKGAVHPARVRSAADSNDECSAAERCAAPGR